METVKLKLKILTPVILTPREAEQKIKGLDWDLGENSQGVEWKKDDRKGSTSFSKEMVREDIEKIGIIYPAYHNGESYYIPATTLKGNIMKLIKVNDAEKEELARNILVKDCEVDKENIKICQLGKITQVKKVEEEVKKSVKRGEENQLKQITAVNPFFPKIAHELIFNPQMPITLMLEVQCRDVETAKRLVNELNKKKSIEKDCEIKQVKKIIKLANQKQSNYSQNENIVNAEAILKKLVEKMNKTKEMEKHLFFIGGYRGFYRAFEEKNHSAIYYIQIAEDVYPVGLCTLEVEGGVENV